MHRTHVHAGLALSPSVQTLVPHEGGTRTGSFCSRGKDEGPVAVPAALSLDARAKSQITNIPQLQGGPRLL